MENEILNRIYNLVLSRDIRDWERSQLMQAKLAIEAGQSVKRQCEQLEILFRPHAIRHTLTPQVDEFYQFMTNNKMFGPGIGNLYY